MSYDSSGMPGSGRSTVSGEDQLPGDWKDAIPSLIASRFGIIRIESKDAIEIAVRKLILLSVALFCLFATWGLLTAGLIGVVSEHFKCPWYFSAFSVGGVYLLISLVVLVIIKKSKKTETFPITRAEFEKDRQWLNQLKNRSK